MTRAMMDKEITSVVMEVTGSHKMISLDKYAKTVFE